MTRVWCHIRALVRSQPRTCLLQTGLPMRTLPSNNSPVVKERHLDLRTWKGIWNAERKRQRQRHDSSPAQGHHCKLRGSRPRVQPPRMQAVIPWTSRRGIRSQTGSIAKECPQNVPGLVRPTICNKAISSSAFVTCQTSTSCGSHPLSATALLRIHAAINCNHGTNQMQDSIQTNFQ